MQNYNLIIDVKDIEAGSPSNSEPVSVPEFKIYARIGSFEDDLGSTSDLPFTTEDSLIGDILTASREALEVYTRRSFIPKEIRVTLTNLAGREPLPYPPIGDVTALYYGSDFEEDGTSATNYVADVVLSGTDIKHLVSPCDERMVIEYSCGYGRGDTQRLPASLKLAILAEATYRFEHRGDEEASSGLCKAARRWADPYRITPLLT